MRETFKNGDVLLVDVSYLTCTIRNYLYLYDNFLFQDYVVNEKEFSKPVGFVDSDCINVIKNTGLNVFETEKEDLL